MATHASVLAWRIPGTAEPGGLPAVYGVTQSQTRLKQLSSSGRRLAYRQSYGFPVIMYGCESWTIKKAKHWRIDAFELWCWRRLLRVPWTARTPNQSILKQTNPEYSLEGLRLKLKLQLFGQLMQRADSLEKALMLGKTEGRRRGQQRMRCLDGITDLMDMSLSKLRRWWRTGKPGLLQSKGSQRVRHDWATEQQGWCIHGNSRYSSLPNSQHSQPHHSLILRSYPHTHSSVTSPSPFNSLSLSSPEFVVHHQQKPKHCISAGFLHLLALTAAWLSPEGSAQGSTFQHSLLMVVGAFGFLTEQSPTGLGQRRVCESVKLSIQF